jgi:glycosyltransferase involved in cell wall biosynthesis
VYASFLENAGYRIHHVPFVRSFAISPLEAMGAGVPVILSDVDGLRDLREDFEDIYWIKPTASEVVNALLHFRGMTSLEKLAIGSRLSEVAHERFGISRGSAGYANLYRNALVV